MVDLILYVLIILLQISDLITTMMALQKKGLKEANPLIQKLIDKLGLIEGLLLAKGVGVVSAFILYQAGATIILLLAVLIYAAIVINNLRHVRNA